MQQIEKIAKPMEFMHAKHGVQQILNQLPDNVPLEDIQYHIYVRRKIERGIEDVNAGRLVSDEEFEKRMARWLDNKMDRNGG